MTEHITPTQFRESDRVDDWRVLAFGACTHFPTESVAAGVVWWTQWAGWRRRAADTRMSTCVVTA
jgi:hypothetical protein